MKIQIILAICILNVIVASAQNFCACVQKTTSVQTLCGSTRSTSVTECMPMLTTGEAPYTVFVPGKGFFSPVYNQQIGFLEWHLMKNYSEIISCTQTVPDQSRFLVGGSDNYDFCLSYIPQGYKYSAMVNNGPVVIAFETLLGQQEKYYECNEEMWSMNRVKTLDTNVISNGLINTAFCKNKRSIMLESVEYTYLDPMAYYSGYGHVLGIQCSLNVIRRTECVRDVVTFIGTLIFGWSPSGYCDSVPNEIPKCVSDLSTDLVIFSPANMNVIIYDYMIRITTFRTMIKCALPSDIKFPIAIKSSVFGNGCRINNYDGKVLPKDTVILNLTDNSIVVPQSISDLLASAPETAAPLVILDSPPAIGNLLENAVTEQPQMMPADDNVYTVTTTVGSNVTWPVAAQIVKIKTPVDICACVVDEKNVSTVCSTENATYTYGCSPVVSAGKNMIHMIIFNNEIYILISNKCTNKAQWMRAADFDSIISCNITLQSTVIIDVADPWIGESAPNFCISQIPKDMRFTIMTNNIPIYPEMSGYRMCSADMTHLSDQLITTDPRILPNITNAIISVDLCKYTPVNNDTDNNGEPPVDETSSVFDFVIGLSRIIMEMQCTANVNLTTNCTLNMITTMLQFAINQEGISCNIATKIPSCDLDTDFRVINFINSHSEFGVYTPKQVWEMGKPRDGQSYCRTTPGIPENFIIEITSAVGPCIRQKICTIKEKDPDSYNQTTTVSPYSQSTTTAATINVNDTASTVSAVNSILADINTLISIFSAENIPGLPINELRNLLSILLTDPNNKKLISDLAVQIYDYLNNNTMLDANIRTIITRIVSAVTI